jgi:hypothetical protein
LTEYKVQFDDKRKQFSQLAEKLPPAGSVVRNSCSAAFDEKPFFDEKGKRYNTEIVMESQLRDPDIENPELHLKTFRRLITRHTVDRPKESDERWHVRLGVGYCAEK